MESDATKKTKKMMMTFVESRHLEFLLMSMLISTLMLSCHHCHDCHYENSRLPHSLDLWGISVENLGVNRPQLRRQLTQPSGEGKHCKEIFSGVVGVIMTFLQGSTCCQYCKGWIHKIVAPDSAAAAPPLVIVFS